MKELALVGDAWMSLAEGDMQSAGSKKAQIFSRRQAENSFVFVAKASITKPGGQASRWLLGPG